MDDLLINKLESTDSVPWQLLLLADPSKEMVEKYLKSGEVYVGYFNKKIIGIYVLVDKSPRVKEIKNVAVDPLYQNKGIGKKLALDAIKRAKIQGAKAIEVGTGNSSLDQLGFYQKCGFRVTGIIKDYFTDNYKEKIIENGIQCIDMILLSLELK